MVKVGVGVNISFRPTEHDVTLLESVWRDQPQMLSPSEIIRFALQHYVNERKDGNGKSQRLDRIEKQLAALTARIGDGTQ